MSPSDRRFRSGVAWQIDLAQPFEGDLVGEAAVALSCRLKSLLTRRRPCFRTGAPSRRVALRETLIDSVTWRFDDAAGTLKHEAVCSATFLSVLVVSTQVATRQCDLCCVSWGSIWRPRRHRFRRVFSPWVEGWFSKAFSECVPLRAELVRVVLKLALGRPML